MASTITKSREKKEKERKKSVLKLTKKVDTCLSIAMISPNKIKCKEIFYLDCP